MLESEMVVVFFDKDGYNPLGSDGTYFARNLKTIRGLQKRMNRPDFVNCTHYKSMMIVPYWKWRLDDVYTLRNSKSYPIFDVGDFQYTKPNLLKEKDNNYKGIDTITGRLL